MSLLAVCIMSVIVGVAMSVWASICLVDVLHSDFEFDVQPNDEEVTK